MADLRVTGSEMLMEWKILVFYKKMTLTEYEIRKATFDEYFRRLGEKPIRPIGWNELRRILVAKDPDLVIPEDLGEKAYRVPVYSYKKKEKKVL